MDSVRGAGMLVGKSGVKRNVADHAYVLHMYLSMNQVIERVMGRVIDGMSVGNVAGHGRGGGLIRVKPIRSAVLRCIVQIILRGNMIQLPAKQ